MTLALVTLLVMLDTQAPLHIVVIEGEGAINIIQQKTAVAPLVEVRDRNNQPIAGATVTFTIQGAKSAVFAGGSQTVTITTNAAGRAVAAAVNPLSSGTVHIQAVAAFQGQTAVATITQTNVLSAAEAAASAGSAGSGGGGLGSGAIAGIAGGVAAAGAAVALTQREQDGDGPGVSQVDPAIEAAAGTYVLQTINGVGLPALSVTSPPAACPVITDNATLRLSTRPQEYEVLENSRTDCRIGASSSFISATNGTWSLSGATITFTPRSLPANYQFDNGTLSAGLLTVTFLPPHAETGVTPARVSSSWRK